MWAVVAQSSFIAVKARRDKQVGTQKKSAEYQVRKKKKALCLVFMKAEARKCNLSYNEFDGPVVAPQMN